MKYVNKSITALVTGTNQGLGKSLALQLLKNNPNSKFLFTTFQNPQKTLKQCPQFVDYTNKGKMVLKNLNLMSDTSIQSFVKQVSDEKWKFDAVVNNAAMGFDQGAKIPDIQWARKLMKTNIYGTIKFTNSLLPYLNKNGRIVNVSSRFAALRNHPQFIVRRFTDPNLQQKTIFESADEFISLCQKNEMGTRFKSAYGTSKMMINAWSRIIMKKKLQHGQVSIVMSPGRCTTDMRKTGGVHSAESGARAIYDCIFMENPSFDVFYHRWEKADFVKCGPQIDAQDEFSNFKG